MFQRAFDLILKILKIFNKHYIFYDNIERRIKNDRILGFLKREILSNDNCIIFDVGAYKGDFIDYFLDKNNVTIYGFEPTNEFYQYLKQKYNRNKNITIENYAVDEKEGQVEFNSFNFGAVNSLLNPNIEVYEQLNSQSKQNFNKSERVLINTTSLSNYMESKGLKEIDLLKVDTQGNDLKVLKSLGSKIKFTKSIITEFHYLKFYENSDLFYEISKYLYENNFYLFSTFNLNKLERVFLLECDAIFLNKEYFPYNLIRELELKCQLY